MSDLRRPFIEALTEEAKSNSDIVFITCDVGFSFLDPLKEVLGNRFLNLGITEQSAMAIATSLAMSGKKVFIYSMIPFMVFRPMEMVRTAAMMLHQTRHQNGGTLCILGITGSKGYAMLGYSHNMISEDEDVDRLKWLPMVVNTPNPPTGSEKEVLGQTIKYLIKRKQHEMYYIRL